jgi:hypothetical protein
MGRGFGMVMVPGGAMRLQPRFAVSRIGTAAAIVCLLTCCGLATVLLSITRLSSGLSTSEPIGMAHAYVPAHTSSGLLLAASAATSSGGSIGNSGSRATRSHNESVALAPVSQRRTGSKPGQRDLYKLVPLPLLADVLRKQERGFVAPPHLALQPLAKHPRYGVSFAWARKRRAGANTYRAVRPLRVHIFSEFVQTSVHTHWLLSFLTSALGLRFVDHPNASTADVILFGFWARKRDAISSVLASNPGALRIFWTRE